MNNFTVFKGNHESFLLMQTREKWIFSYTSKVRDFSFFMLAKNVDDSKSCKVQDVFIRGLLFHSGIGCSIFPRNAGWIGAINAFMFVHVLSEVNIYQGSMKPGQKPPPVAPLACITLSHKGAAGGNIRSFLSQGITLSRPLPHLQDLSRSC